MIAKESDLVLGYSEGVSSIRRGGDLLMRGAAETLSVSSNPVVGVLLRGGCRRAGRCPEGSNKKRLRNVRRG